MFPFWFSFRRHTDCVQHLTSPFNRSISYTESIIFYRIKFRGGLNLQKIVIFVSVPFKINPDDSFSPFFYLDVNYWDFWLLSCIGMYFDFVSLVWPWKPQEIRWKGEIGSPLTQGSVHFQTGGRVVVNHLSDVRSSRPRRRSWQWQDGTGPRERNGGP